MYTRLNYLNELLVSFEHTLNTVFVQRIMTFIYITHYTRPEYRVTTEHLLTSRTYYSMDYQHTTSVNAHSSNMQGMIQQAAKSFKQVIQGTQQSTKHRYGPKHEVSNKQFSLTKFIRKVPRLLGSIPGYFPDWC